MTSPRTLDTSAIPRPRFFHGWLVVAGAFAVMFVGFCCA